MIEVDDIGNVVGDECSCGDTNQFCNNCGRVIKDGQPVFFGNQGIYDTFDCKNQKENGGDQAFKQSNDYSAPVIG